MIKKIIVVFLLFCVPFVSAHTIRMNFAYSIEGSDVIRVDNRIFDSETPEQLTFTNPEKKFLASSSGDVAAAIIFAGESFISMGLDTTIPSDYLFHMTQNDDNRFVLALTKGDWRNIDSGYVEDIPTKTFGSFISSPGNQLDFFGRVDYFDIDIVSDIRLRDSRKVLIRNTGIQEGKYTVSIGEAK